MSMIKLTISNNLSRNTVIVNSESTLRSVIEENGMDFNSGMMNLDGSTIPVGGLDRTFDDYQIDPNVQHYLTRVVKADNAARAVVSGAAMVISANASYEDIAMIKKYRPEALILRDEKKEPVFFVDVSKTSTGAINTFGASFGTRSDATGMATITVTVPEDAGDVRAWAEDYLGSAILKLSKLEEQYAAMIDEISAEKAAVAESISVL